MLLEEYVKETQGTIARILTMFDSVNKTAEQISLDYVADEDSIEADLDITEADTGLVSAAIEDSKAQLKDISIGLKQVLERSQELIEVSARRKDRIKHLDGRIYEQESGEKIKDEDKELREAYAPLFEGLSEREIQERLAQIKKVRGK